MKRGLLTVLLLGGAVAMAACQPNGPAATDADAQADPQADPQAGNDVGERHGVRYL